MKPLRILLSALAAVIVAGTIASAAPGVRGGPEDEPSPQATVSPEASVPTEPTDPPELTGSVSPSVSETPSPSELAAETEDDSAAPDFSACEGATGLENAICRHEALLDVHPDNPGLQNALAHLEANRARHAEEEDGAPEAEGTVDASCPGRSCEENGNGQGHGEP